MGTADQTGRRGAELERAGQEVRVTARGRVEGETTRQRAGNLGERPQHLWLDTRGEAEPVNKRPRPSVRKGTGGGRQHHG